MITVSACQEVIKFCMGLCKSRHNTHLLHDYINVCQTKWPNFKIIIRNRMKRGKATKFQFLEVL